MICFKVRTKRRAQYNMTATPAKDHSTIHAKAFLLHSSFFCSTCKTVDVRSWHLASECIGPWPEHHPGICLCRFVRMNVVKAPPLQVQHSLENWPTCRLRACQDTGIAPRLEVGMNARSGLRPQTIRTGPTFCRHRIRVRTSGRLVENEPPASVRSKVSSTHTTLNFSQTSGHRTRSATASRHGRIKQGGNVHAGCDSGRDAAPLAVP